MRCYAAPGATASGGQDLGLHSAKHCLPESIEIGYEGTISGRKVEHDEGMVRYAASVRFTEPAPTDIVVRRAGKDGVAQADG
jgi:hypothetical protein